VYRPFGGGTASKVDVLPNNDISASAVKVAKREIVVWNVSITIGVLMPSRREAIRYGLQLRRKFL